ncbi:Ubiquitin-conjugating enzyme E2Q-like protein [Paramyrothecium foliicola]|nr:Ubiquitin-conjugating enzyme E2Q-like protein [Paramyrothecium foliicola]
MSQPLKPHWQQPSHPQILELIINEADFSSKSIARVSLPPNALFAKLSFPPCTIASKAAYSTVQFGKDQHLELNSDLLYVNHSCEPSLIFDTDNFNVVVGPKGIQAGEELTPQLAAPFWLFIDAMTLKQFNADVAKARSQNFRGVTNIRRGDSDGEVIFCFQPEWLSSPLDIQVLTPDPDSYPSKSSFMVFTATELEEDNLESTLEKLSASCGNKSVSEVVDFISSTLVEKPENCTITTPECTDLEDLEYDSDDENHELSSGALFDNHLFGLATNPQRFGDGVTEKRLRQDLEMARSVGLRVGVFKGPSSRYVEAISLSIRASKLGIAEDSLEAWGLRASDYLVLLMAFPRGYPLPGEYVELPSNQLDIQLLYGKCLQPKPSVDSTRRALIADTRTRLKKEIFKENAENITTASGEGDFLPIRMSQAIDYLLNERLPGLIRLRQSNHFGWDEAQAQLFRQSRTSTSGTQQTPVPTMAADDFMISKGAPEALSHDFAMDKVDDFNIPLVCMQFALRRFAKCTQYCMVCHQKMPGGFDALKPYVCSDELCLYQFLSLGLGTSLEHEIVHNPFVVDLLVSFFYASLNNKALREFPRGLGLKAFHKDASWASGDYLEGEAYISGSRLRFSAISQDFKTHFRVGSVFIMVFSNGHPLQLISVVDGDARTHYCRVLYIADTWCDYETLHTDQSFLQAPLVRPGSSYYMPVNGYEVQVNDSSGQTSSNGELCKVTVFIEKYELDELESEQRDIALMFLTKRIPRVLDMHSNVLSLLRWIVASNTSLVVQDEQVPEPECPDTKDAVSARKVQGVGTGWMQFRFAQGSPAKEQRFTEELKNLKTGNLVPAKYPTLFAWHGSPIGNWHSIIRSGLDFQSQLHGRAYGNGVYFSDTMNTSLGYSNRAPAKMGMPLPESWEQACDGYLKLCPEIKGFQGQAINIPRLALPTSRRYDFEIVSLGKARHAGRATRNHKPEDRPIYISDDEEDLAELDLLTRVFDHGQGETSKADGKRRWDHEFESLSMSLPLSKVRITTGGIKIKESQSQDGPSHVTSFLPGTLDLESLPKLPEPAWASSTTSSALRNLGREVKQQQKLQSSSAPDALGWHINFDKLENIFHWIVELHSFSLDLPLAQDMEKIGCKSIVLELRFGSGFPFSPPFVRVIRPRFRTFAEGGGGHVTAGGAICSELLTNSGWSPALSIDKVFLDVRLRLSDLNPPARLAQTQQRDYGIIEAAEAYRRAVRSHGWEVPQDLEEIVKATWA